MPDAFRLWAEMARRRHLDWETDCHRPAGCTRTPPIAHPVRSSRSAIPATRRLPNGSAFFPGSVNTQSENVWPLRTENSSRVPSRDHDSGTCSSSLAAVVSRSAVPPSAGCHQIARSPSRADWKVTRRLSADHTGKRLPPPNVNRLISVCRGESVRPDVRRWTIVPANGEHATVRRDPRMDVDRRRNLQRHDVASCVAEDQTARCQRRRRRTRHVRERAGLGDGELCRAGLCAEGAPNACDHRLGLSGDREACAHRTGPRRPCRQPYTAGDRSARTGHPNRARSKRVECRPRANGQRSGRCPTGHLPRSSPP